MDPVEIMVMPEQTVFDLSSDPQLVARLIYSIVVFAENSFGRGPPSNVVFYRRPDGSELTRPLAIAILGYIEIEAFGEYSETCVK